jgi:hypothetical protein
MSPLILASTDILCTGTKHTMQLRADVTQQGLRRAWSKLLKLEELSKSLAERAQAPLDSRPMTRPRAGIITALERELNRCYCYSTGTTATVHQDVMELWSMNGLGNNWSLYHVLAIWPF